MYVPGEVSLHDRGQHPEAGAEVPGRPGDLIHQGVRARGDEGCEYNCDPIINIGVKMASQVDTKKYDWRI